MRPVITLVHQKEEAHLKEQIWPADLQQRAAVQIRHTAQKANIYETKFILYFTYLYINISSLK